MDKLSEAGAIGGDHNVERIEANNQIQGEVRQRSLIQEEEKDHTGI